MSDYVPPFKEGDTVEDLEILSVGLLAGGVTATRCRGKVNGVEVEFDIPGTYTLAPSQRILDMPLDFSIDKEETDERHQP